MRRLDENEIERVQGALFLDTITQMSYGFILGAGIGGTLTLISFCLSCKKPDPILFLTPTLFVAFIPVAKQLGFI